MNHHTIVLERSSRVPYRMHACARCGRRFARAENLRKHQRKKNRCLPIIRNQDACTPAWDPIPDTVPRYNGLECPFCTKTLSSISNRDRHIRHYCEHAKVVFFEREVELRVNCVKDTILKYLQSLDPNTSVRDVLNSQNIITNRGNG
jgi:hypothetical protein